MGAAVEKNFAIPQTYAIAIGRTREWLRISGAAMLHGVRLWAAVCLAIYTSFWLQLDNPYWAAVAAAIVHETSLGASLRKARYYVVGSTIGAVAVVMLSGCYPQNRCGFLAGLSIWIGGCSVVSSMLSGTAGFAAALAGITAAIIASVDLGSTGGVNDGVFMIALTRGSNICIGIVAASAVFSWTDFGIAGRRVFNQIDIITASIGNGIVEAYSTANRGEVAPLPDQREFTNNLTALDRLIGEAVEESAELRLRWSTLQGGIAQLLVAFSNLRIIIAQINRFAVAGGRDDIAAITQLLSHRLHSVGEPRRGDPAQMRRAHLPVVRALRNMPTKSHSAGLLVERTVEVLLALQRVPDGLASRRNADGSPGGLPTVSLHAPDWLPSIVIFLRTFLTIALAEFLWIVTAWPSGAMAWSFAAIYVSLLTLRGDQARSMATDFLVGVCVTGVAAAVVKLAVLPNVETFFGFSLAIGGVIIPAGTMIALRLRPALFTFVSIFFMLLLGPENHTSYDPQQLYDAALAMLVGMSAAALGFGLIRPMSSEWRARRVVFFALRDLRRLLDQSNLWTPEQWVGRIYSRISAFPASANQQRYADVMTLLSLGSEVIELRCSLREAPLRSQVDAALQEFAQGNRVGSMESLSRIDGLLAAQSTSAAPGAVSARGRVIAILEAIAREEISFG